MTSNNSRNIRRCREQIDGIAQGLHLPAPERRRRGTRHCPTVLRRTIVTPRMVYAKLGAEVVEEVKAKGISKPIVVSLAGDVEVEEAAEYLFDHGVPAYPYSTEMPVAPCSAPSIGGHAEQEQCQGTTQRSA